MKTAFTLWEADFSIYLEDSRGVYSGVPLFAGGCAEKLDIGRRFDRTAIRRPGFPYARQHASDESHSIKIQNVWTWAEGTSPDWSRWDRYVITVVWWDEDSGAWSKCSWRGVTLSEDSLDGQDAVSQELVFAAEYRTPIKTGLDPNRPNLLPILPTAEIWYVDATTRRRIYTYEDDAALLVPVTPLDARATIDLSGGQCRILFGATQAIGIVGGVLGCGSLNGTHTYGVQPCLEFWRGAFRLASISSTGEVAANDFTETALPPSVVDDIVLNSGTQWQCSIGRAGISAESFYEK